MRSRRSIPTGSTALLSAQPHGVFPSASIGITGTFGGLSAGGTIGAFVAAVNGDVGSPGTIVNLQRFTTVSVASGQFSLSLFTQPQRNYRIEYKASLSDPARMLNEEFLMGYRPLAN